jgi:hypothetical protein
LQFVDIADGDRCDSYSQVLANIESAQRQNRLYDALKQGNTALAALQQVSSLRGLPAILMNPSPSIAPSTLQRLAEYIALGFFRNRPILWDAHPILYAEHCIEGTSEGPTASCLHLVHCSKVRGPRNTAYTCSKRLLRLVTVRQCLSVSCPAVCVAGGVTGGGGAADRGQRRGEGV